MWSRHCKPAPKPIKKVEEAIALQRHAIAALLGQGPDRGLALERPTVQLSSSFGLPAKAHADLLGHRPDITAARWRAEAAASRVGMAQADYYPNVNLSAFIGTQALGVQQLRPSGFDGRAAGPRLPTLFLPLDDSTVNGHGAQVIPGGGSQLQRHRVTRFP